MSEEKSKSSMPNLPKVHVMSSSTKEAPLKGNAGPSALRQLLPIVLCLLSFASVLTVLIIYMDTTGEFLNLKYSKPNAIIFLFILKQISK